jgi:hypothetical protein
MRGLCQLPTLESGASAQSERRGLSGAGYERTSRWEVFPERFQP